MKLDSPMNIKTTPEAAMIAPLALSFDLDDTLWPVGPVIAAAEKELLCWLREHHPQTVSGHSIESMRELRKGLNGSLDDEKDKNKTTETKPNRTIS